MHLEEIKRQLDAMEAAVNAGSQVLPLPHRLALQSLFQAFLAVQRGLLLQLTLTQNHLIDLQHRIASLEQQR